MGAVTEFKLPHYLHRIASGKVREIYELSNSELMFVTTDRISAYDIVLSNGVDQKGSILTQLSDFWFRLLQKEIPSLSTHLISLGVPDAVKLPLLSDHCNGVVAQLEPRTMVVKKVKVLPLESIVRGYLTGSAWSSYQKDGTVLGIAVTAGLKESQKLDRALWTPSTKAPVGEADENISAQEAAKIVGEDRARQIEKLSLDIYDTATIYAAKQGIILADTKFEFGIDESDSLILVDEVLTPDSSRFWDAGKYEIGRGQESFDKQYLRDWLTKTSQKGKCGVLMPEDIAANTSKRYKEAYRMLVGQNWEDK